MSESTAAPEHLDFEAALTELERIVQALETGRLPLETALQRYQQGVALVRRCRQVLDEAEQRLLAMCAEKKLAHAAALSDLPALFGGAQNGYFTHIWGFKQQMRENPELYEDFCRRCAARLQKDFPEESKTIANIAELSPFFA